MNTKFDQDDVIEQLTLMEKVEPFTTIIRDFIELYTEDVTVDDLEEVYEELSEVLDLVKSCIRSNQ